MSCGERKKVEDGPTPEGQAGAPTRVRATLPTRLGPMQAGLKNWIPKNWIPKNWIPKKLDPY